jgi:hypothetical protein
MGLMTWGQLRLQLRQSAPGYSLDLIDESLNNRYARVLDHVRWNWLEARASVETETPYVSSTDLVSVTQGSNAITGTGTAWTSDLNGQKFQAAADGPFYTFTYVSSTSATLDRPYEGGTQTGIGYTLFTNIYALPADCKAVLQVSSADDGFDLTNLDEMDLGESVGFRDEIGNPDVYAVTPSPEDLDGGTTWQIELFPIPNQQKGYPILYQRAAPGFDGSATGDSPLPFVTDAVILAGGRADLFLHLDKFDKAKFYEAKFTDELMAMVRADQIKGPKAVLQMAPRFTRCATRSPGSRTKMQASDMVTRGLERLDEPGGGYYTYAEMLAALNEAMRFFALLTLGLEATATFALAANTTFYHMQSSIADWLMPLRVRIAGGAFLRPGRIEDLDALDSGWQASNGTPSRYLALGFDFFGVYQQPSDGSVSLDITYARCPVPLIAATDVPEFPEDTHPAFIDYAVPRLRYREGGQEFQKSLVYFSRFMDEAKRYGNYIRSRSLAERYDKQPFELERMDLSKMLKLRADLMPARRMSDGQ